jgi:hypothetical protein
MTDERREELTEACLVLLGETFPDHDLESLQVKALQCPDDEAMVVLVITASLIPVSGIGEPIRCGGTVFIDEHAPTMRMHVVSA